MRSYYSHLATTTSKKDSQKKAPAIHRSSAIFPIWENQQFSTRLLFLGYWLLKRKIEHLDCVITLRAENGEQLAKNIFPIQQAKAFRIEAKDYIPKTLLPFFGSIEIEFLADEDLVFPFPAVSVNYYGETFSSVVHTAERVFNNDEDAEINKETIVPESGFTLYCDEDRTPFFTLINGSKEQVEQTLEMRFINHQGNEKKIAISLKKMAPYETRAFFLNDSTQLIPFLNGKPGACKLSFHLASVFPRLLAGNRLQKEQAQVVTHTYYDCSHACSPTDFWKESDPNWHVANLMIPYLGGETYQTAIDIYPIFSPSPFALDLEFYGANGELFKKVTDFLKVEENFKQFLHIPLQNLLPSTEPLGARLIARPLTDKPIPARIKVAFDIGIKSHLSMKGLPCNICTNLQPYVPAFSLKPSSFKWSPFLADQKEAWVFLMNSSPIKEGHKVALLTLTFYRESDGEILERKAEIAPHGFLWINLVSDSELKTFFQGNPGWITVTTNNPYLNIYYFALHPESGVVGGDHGY